MIVPGASYLVTRRCHQRQYLLRPSRDTNRILEYVIAVAAQRTGVLLHAVCVLSNHVHLVLTDPLARLPRFEQYLDSLVARAINASLGRRGYFWEPGGYSAVVLPSPADVVAKAAYVLANPTASGLVRCASDWPGVWTAPARLGGSRVEVARPGRFFKPTGSMPDRAELVLALPPGFESAEDFRSQVEAALGALEERHAREHPRVLGPELARAQSPWGCPDGDEPLRRMKPRVAALDAGARAEALCRIRAFLQAYRDAWESWVAGIRDVLFPFGTYGMRVNHAAACLESG